MQITKPLQFLDRSLSLLTDQLHKVHSPYTTLSRNIRTVINEWSSEAILVSLISSILLFFCILLFFFLFTCLNCKNYIKFRCRCKPFPTIAAVQCSGRNRNLGKFLNKPFLLEQSPNFFSLLHCSYLLTCCNKIRFNASPNLSPVELSKNNPFSHHLLQLNNSSSFLQKPSESATVLPPEVRT